MPKRPRTRRSRSTIVRRWLAVGGLALIAFLYYKPLRSYFETRGALAQGRVEVHKLRVEQQRLERRVVRSSSTEELVRQARSLGFVKPGERLFIVKGISEWRREARARRATIARHGS
jgi:Septum formation initiator